MKLGSAVELHIERTASNTIEAAANGTSDGLKLWLNVVAMLIAFMGLVALVDWLLAVVAENRFWALEGGLSLDRIFTELRDVPFRDNVWPEFLRENAIRVFKLEE